MRQSFVTRDRPAVARRVPIRILIPEVLHDESFLSATDPDAWAESRGTVGCVVVLDRAFPAETAPAQLFEEYGLRGDGDGLAHYQLVASGEYLVSSRLSAMWTE